MSLHHNHYTLLDIIANYNNGEPVGSPTIDRVFYDRRLREGISVEELYEVKWIPLASELTSMQLIERQGLSNRITNKGKEFLKNNRGSQS